MSYIEELKNTYDIDDTDIYSMIVVSGNLKEPFNGWSGLALAQVFGDKTYKIYFGDFPESLAAYENLQEFEINRRISKDSAALMFKSWISENIKKKFIVVSSNARYWTLPFILNLKSIINVDINSWDLKDIYSLKKDEGILDTFNAIYNAFDYAKPLPKTFGLSSIAEATDIHMPKLGPQPVYRALLTARIAEKLLSQ